MKRKEKKLLRETPLEELAKQIKDLQGEISDYKFKKESAKIRNLHELKTLRIKLAVFKTIHRERKLKLGD